MKNKTLVGLALIVIVLVIIIAILASIAFSGDDGETPGLAVVDIKIEDPKPSLLSDRSITIDYGESVTVNVTVKNKGKNITSGDDYSVGLLVITHNGDKYWQLPPEQVMGIDLGPGGKSRHTFTAINKKEYPFRGECELQAYIKSVETGEEIARSDIVYIEIRYPP